MKALCRRLSRRLVVRYFVCLCLGAIVAAPGDGIAASASGKVNRTLLKVQPPETTLEFSANPTTQEVFRALVFAEPLFPKVQDEREGVKRLTCSQLLPVTVGAIQELNQETKIAELKARFGKIETTDEKRRRTMKTPGSTIVPSTGQRTFSELTTHTPTTNQRKDQ